MSMSHAHESFDVHLANFSEVESHMGQNGPGHKQIFYQKKNYHAADRPVRRS